MFDGSTPTDPDSPAPFAVGYGCGLGNGSGGRPSTAPPAASGATAGEVPAVDLRATVAVTPIDLGATRALAPVAADLPPFTSRPVGAAHPRRRLGRGLVLAGVALLAVGSGVGAVALASGPDLTPAAASAHPAAAASAASATSTIGGRLGRGVDPTSTTTVEAPTVTVPVSIIEPIVVTRVPLPAPTVPPTTAPPTTTPPTTTPPATTPPTTPPTTTPPTTAPAGPSFTALVAPADAACPTPASDVTISFSWSAADTTEVTLSIDGPGVYRTYAGSTGSETVSFSCSSSHTYRFAAYGAGGSVATRTVTVTPS